MCPGHRVVNNKGTHEPSVLLGSGYPEVHTLSYAGDKCLPCEFVLMLLRDAFTVGVVIA